MRGDRSGTGRGTEQRQDTARRARRVFRRHQHRGWLTLFDGICAKQTGRFVARGIPLELLVLMGVAKPDARSLDDCKPEAVSRGGATVLIPNIEQFKLLADHLVTQHGEMLRPLYHSLACDVATRDGRLTAVVVANKDGLTRVEAKQVIDCTGDGDIAAWAGCPIEKTTPAMPMTLHFRIGHVRKVPDLGKNAKQALAEAHGRGELPLYYGPGLIFCFADDEASASPGGSRGPTFLPPRICGSAAGSMTRWPPAAGIWTVTPTR
jgi:hypothetical protein